MAYSSIINPIGEPISASTLAVDAVDAAVGEFDIPVVAFDGGLGPPLFFQVPGAGGDFDAALEAELFRGCIVE